MEFDFNQALKDKYPNESLAVIEYINTKKPCVIKCETCGRIFKYKKGYNALSKEKKYMCPSCGKHNSIKNRFKQSILAIFPNEKATILSFSTTQKPLDIQCDECGKIYHYERALSLLSRKHICSVCHPIIDNRMKETVNRFIEFIQHGDEWEILSDLGDIKASDMIECRCKKCGKINSKGIYDYLKGIHCTCSRWDCEEKFLNECSDEYIPLDPITHYRNRVRIQHCCGFQYSVNIQSFINGGSKCPKCSKNHSHGENKIKRWLDKNDIEYEMEYPVILDGHALRFDFYLPALDLFIEFQGKQHYEPSPFFDSATPFEQRKYYDNLKRDYCKEKLIEIPYFQIDEIDNILSSKVQRPNM